jgi:hypothetical protein
MAFFVAEGFNIRNVIYLIHLYIDLMHMNNIVVELTGTKARSKEMLKTYLNYKLSDNVKKARNYGIIALIFLLLGFIIPSKDSFQNKEVFFTVSFMFGLICFFIYITSKKVIDKLLYKFDNDSDSLYDDKYKVTLIFNDDTFKFYDVNMSLEFPWKNFKEFLEFKTFYVIESKSIFGNSFFISFEIQSNENFPEIIKLIESKLSLKKVNI